MDDLMEWERALLRAPDPVPVPVAQAVPVTELKPGMRIHNGYDPYRVVVRTGMGEWPGTTRVTYTTDGTREYTGVWYDDACMPVAAPLLYRFQ